MTIKTDSIGKRFNRDWVFRNLSYTFTPGNVYAITGANGSGKSTLLKILWGQMSSTAGSIKYESDDSLISQEEFYSHVAIAAPYMELIEEFTLIEQLRFHFKLRKSHNGVGIDEMLDGMYLAEAKNKQIHNFSSGMKQRLKLGLAFYTESLVTFLDEPSTNLDSRALGWYHEGLGRLQSRSLVIIASNQKEEYATNAICLNVEDFK